MIPFFILKTSGYIGYYLCYYATTCVYRLLTADPSALALAVLLI